MSQHLIVIPAFNEARTIAAVAAEARRNGPVLVVDDGSTDRTAAEARAAGVEVLEFPRRLGKGAALRAGVDVARQRGADRVITLDGDGQHDPRDIPLLCGAARRSPRAIVVGGRVPNADETPCARWNACRVAGFFINWITGASLRDTQSGFRSYPLGLFDEVTLYRGGFVLETELLVAAARVGRPLVEVDVSAYPSVRPSRFHPLGDGCAIGAYMAARVAGQLGREALAAGRELTRLFDRERRRMRHAEMAAAGVSYPNAPHLCGVAIGSVAVSRAWARVCGWWRDSRRRRATLVVRAIVLSPVTLALSLAHPALSRLGADLVTPFVDRFYSQERLAATEDRRVGSEASGAPSEPITPAGPGVSAESRLEVPAGLSLE